MYRGYDWDKTEWKNGKIWLEHSGRIRGLGKDRMEG